jgi:hypothetical protein
LIYFLKTLCPGKTAINFAYEVMPEESRKKLCFANLSMKFVHLAKLGSASDHVEAIARRHIREMVTEFSQLNKVKKKKKTSSASGYPTTP